MGFVNNLPNVYFNQYVCVENARLWVLYMLANVCIVVVILYSVFGVTDIYKVDIKAMLRLQVYRNDLADLVFMAGTTYNSLEKSLTSSVSSYDYSPPDSATSWSFTSPTTKPLCFANSDPASCVDAGAVVVTDTDSLFVATAYQEELSLRVDDNDCPFALDADSNCRRVQNYLVPGVEGFTANFMHQYQIKLPKSYAHEMTGSALLPTTELLTVIYSDYRGEELRRFGHNERGYITVHEALWAVGVDLDSAVDGNQKIFPADRRTGELPKVRIIGVDITVAMAYSNGHKDYESYDGPVCKITVSGTPGWVGREETVLLDLNGSSRTRLYSGVRIRFQQTDKFQWFQLNELLYTLTLSAVWMRLPFLVVFYVTVYCLGALSDVYTGFLYEEVNLEHEFNGVSARMLEKSYGFSDIYDEVFSDRVGVSLRRLKHRMKMVLGSSEELSEGEREAFSEFYFAYIAKSIMHDESNYESAYLCIFWDEFIRAATNSENVLYEDVIHLIDTDAIAKRNMLERFFLDSSLKRFSSTLENQERERRMRKARATAGMEDPNYDPDSAGVRTSQIVMQAQQHGAKNGSQQAIDAQIKVLGKTTTLATVVLGSQVIDKRLQELQKNIGLLKKKMLPKNTRGSRAASQVPKITRGATSTSVASSVASSVDL